MTTLKEYLTERKGLLEQKVHDYAKSKDYAYALKYSEAVEEIKKMIAFLESNKL
jgi:hypothetical protein